ncbi:MAG: RagB/SusD family nutrient uptake outer membrane protein [Prevotellaceae bacterium]|nr:RagB/SusD family nutrient uptake outer membrane protein [Prevotellaceae bacterium]
MKKNIFNIALALTLGLGATSCNDWLDVKPSDQVEDTDLFTSEQGFKEALSGVYSSMLTESTYTKDMLFGAIGVLAHEWSSTPSTGYPDLANYDYTTTYAESYFSGIWASNYNSIANVNNVLKYIDENRALFYGHNYEIIKGEALALRAFLHFDLLRCFGVSYEVNKDMPAIPYCDNITYKVFPQLTVSQVAEKVMADLATAESLLKTTDPIATGEEVTEMDDKGYLINRKVHMNYYAVRALQARVYMWTKQYDKALAAAQEVIDSEQFPWTPADEFTGNSFNLAYQSMTSEHIFGLHNLNLYSIADNYFNDQNTSRSFSISLDDRAAYYDNETTDLRYLYMFEAGVENVTSYYLKKYTVPSPVGQVTVDATLTNKIPMIRIAEMELIKSECDYRAGGTGLDAINVLRRARGLEDISVDEVPNYYDFLVREYRRELIGEGQLWFLYKRLNRENILGYTGDAFTTKSYTFPIPKSETEMAERQENR